MTTEFRTCPLCEATCGLALTIEDGRVVRVRGDDDDVFSQGYACPKGIALGELHHDPSRLRTPLVRGADGTLRPATWDDAFAEIARLLSDVRREHGNDAVGVYLGNPNAHNAASALYLPALVRALGTTMVFSASTVDQMPAQVAAGLMFGTGLSVPIPDIDRTQYLLILGGNPLVSNGSMWTAPDLPRRIRDLRRRGGRLVVVDPVRTRTAEAADEHLFVRPGADAFLLAAMAHTMLADGLVQAGAAGPHLAGGHLDAVREALAPLSPESVAAVTGIEPDATRRLAHEVATAPSAAVYGRMGTTTSGVRSADGPPQSFGTAASWLITLVNLLSGNLDREGGVMWPLPAAGGPTTAGTPGVGHGIRIPGSRRTRVRGLASVLGEFPVAALAEEIDTPSAEGTPLRALITVAGNPVVSTPDADRLDAALTRLDALISVDAYLTESNRHAHVILPAASPLTRGHYDITFSSLAVRNVARWCPPSLPLGTYEGCREMDEGDVLLRLACIAAGDTITVDQMDDLVALDVAARATRAPASRAFERDPADLLAAVAPRTRLARLIDLMVRSGPYGDGFGGFEDGLTLTALEAAPHGIDLGPLRPRLPEVLRTPSGRIEAAPAQLLDEARRMVDAIAGASDRSAAVGLVLVGRRSLRSNNSWMHNVPLLAGGSNRCTLLMHADDAAAHGLSDGQEATVSNDVGSVTVTVEVSDAVMPGVVSLPHGWGHSPGTWGPVAAQRPGANSNTLTASGGLDGLAGTAVLNGIPVHIAPTAARRLEASGRTSP